MTESQRIQKELDEMMASFSKTKNENTVIEKLVKSNRSYTYRTSPSINASDVRSL